MKPLIDDKLVPSRCYYYLLDWNERDDKSFIATKFNKHRLCDLESTEFWTLFQYAVDYDIKHRDK